MSRKSLHRHCPWRYSRYWQEFVKIMLEGKGFEVIDLGTNVEPETFVNTAKEEKCDIICLSALLTTTRDEMKIVIDEVKNLVFVIK